MTAVVQDARARLDLVRADARRLKAIYGELEQIATFYGFAHYSDCTAALPGIRVMYNALVAEAAELKHRLGK